MTLTATIVAVDLNDILVVDPSMQQIKLSSSIHVLAFSSHGDLLVVESEGDFTIDIWDEVYQKAKSICHGEEGDESDSEDVSMESDGVSKLEDMLKDAVEKTVSMEQRWKKSVG